MAELLFVAGAENNGGDGGAAEEPVEGDLRDAFAGFFGDGVEGVHYFIDVFIGDWRADVSGFVQTALFGERVATADFTG